MAQERVIGILLAGGLSSRYGEPKAFATWKNKKFYIWSYNILHDLCDEVIVVTREDLQALFPKNIVTITDVEPFVGCGPLAGIYSAMETVEGTQYVVLPCDMPLMEKDVIKKLIEKHKKGVTVVKTEHYIQALVSIWDKSMKQLIYEALIQKQYKIKAVLKEPYVHMVEGKSLTDEAHIFSNINTKEEERRLEAWYRL